MTMQLAAKAALGFFAVIPSLALAQVGGPPIPPPGGASWHFGSMFVHGGSSGTQVLAMETGPGLRTANVYSMDASGDLVADSSVSITGGWFVGLGEDRILARENYQPTKLRVLERTATGWSSGYYIEGPAHSVTADYAYTVAIDGKTALVSDPLHSEIDVFDLSAPGVPLLVDEIVLPAGKFAITMAFDGATIAVLAAIPILGGIRDAELLTYARLPSGFAFQSSVTFGPEFDLNQAVALDVRGVELAVGFPEGTLTDPCGRVVVLTRLGNLYVLPSEIADSGSCLLTPEQGAGFGASVELGRVGELFIKGGANTGFTQFLRNAAGQWSPGQRHLTDASGGFYAIARSWILGITPVGLQVFDNVSSQATAANVCAATIPTTLNEWRLDYSGSYSLGGGGGEFRITFDSMAFGGAGVTGTALLLTGSERGARVLGPAASLCIGGAIRRLPMDANGVLSNTGAALGFDPNSFGVTAGETVLFQTWARPPGYSAGATSNAVAITFIP